jgi:phosphate transport system permease protein
MGVTEPSQTAASDGRPILVTVVAILLALAAVVSLVGGVVLCMLAGDALPEGGEAEAPEEGAPSGQLGMLETILAAIVLTGLCVALAWGVWRMKNWARTGVIMLTLGLGLAYYMVTVVFRVAAEIFGGERVVPWGEMFRLLAIGVWDVLKYGLWPALAIYVMMRYEADFEENPGTRRLVDRAVRYVLLVMALSAIFVVVLIILFTVAESWEAISVVGLDSMLLGAVWRPGSIIGTEDTEFGLVPMVVGSILSTFGAALIGVPLSLFAAILLAEIAPPLVRETFRPAIELLAGIPSVVYGLFGMVVLAPLIRQLWPNVPYNSGSGLLSASVILAVMIIPTITNIAEDAIRAVPRAYKEGALALGSTHWQTIRDVILPAARSGIVAAIILGIGRALGETMAMIMVIGNSIAVPKPLLKDNPLTIGLSSARTLTGNIAVEINYAAGAHRSALFFTGVLLFTMILLVNSVARFLMRERLRS